MDSPQDRPPSHESPSSDSDQRPPIERRRAASPPPPPPPPPQGYGYPPGPGSGGGRSGSILGKIASSVVASLLVISLLLNVYLGMMVAAQLQGPVIERTYRGGSGESRIAVIPVEGMILDETADFIRQAFDHLEGSPPQAIVLRVNSGGGAVGPSDRIWRRIKRWQAENPDVPVVASFGDVAASGGYYVAVSSEAIFAEPSCVTGSIGVMLQAFTLEELMDKIGVTPETMVATNSPDKDVANNIFRSWTAEDREKFQKLLDSAYRQFFDAVREGRSDQFDSEDELAASANGDIFTAQEAVDRKLVDEVGYLDDALARAESLAGLAAGEPRVVVIAQTQPGLLGLLGVSHRSAPLNGLGGLGGAAAAGGLSDLLNDPGRWRDQAMQAAMPRLYFMIPH